MSRRARLVLTPLAAATAGVVVVGIVMGLVLLFVRVMPRDESGWGDLVLVVVGTLLAVGVGVLVWLGGLVWAARHLFDAGRRLGAVILAVSAVFVVVLVVSGIAGERDLSRVVSGVLTSLGVLLVLATPSVVFVLWDRREATLLRKSRSVHLSQH